MCKSGHNKKIVITEDSHEYNETLFCFSCGEVKNIKHISKVI